MLVRIQPTEGGDGGDLLRWLRKDPVAAEAMLSVLPAEPGQSEMGVADVIQAVVSDGSALGSLIVSVAAWRDARRQGRDRSAVPTVRIQCGAATVELTTADPAEVRRILDALAAPNNGTAGEGETSS
ncbi:hypothetical protein [Kitasatospora sp. NPDC058190]|uniref:effector-associated constant component EACC1 n=1 Tax=Kitasatospora sp. NPDC058190 TaxID=3346371 RepID=UPI0036DDACE2